MRTYLDLQRTNGGRLRVSRTGWGGVPRLAIRELSEDGGGRLRHGRSGISVPLSQVPALREALSQAEEEALRSGLLREVDYTAAGLSAPNGISGDESR